MTLTPFHAARGVALYHGDCREVVGQFEPESISGICTDPPYGLSFMGKGWDRGVPGVEFWQIMLAACKPGAHLLAFGGTRTYHRLACAIEDAGFEVRDCLSWLYGSGFPKSLDVSKAIDRAAGNERPIIGPTLHNCRADMKYGAAYAPNDHGIYSPVQHGPQTAPASAEAAAWSGWGTALKPAWEPIILARKPLIGTVAENVLTHGTGALHIDACRVGSSGGTPSVGEPNELNNVYGAKMGGLKSVPRGRERDQAAGSTNFAMTSGRLNENGRFPANLLLDETAAAMLDAQSGESKSTIAKKVCRGNGTYKSKNIGNHRPGHDTYVRESLDEGFADSGGASRFFYTAKASGTDRGNYVEAARPLFGEAESEFRNDHPTVKPLAVMEWLLEYLLTLIGPPGGLILDPFSGSGTTLVAAASLGLPCVGVELDAHFCDIAAHRLATARPNK